MINIPYDFVGTVKYQRYDTIVERIKQFKHRVIGKDQSGIYDMYVIELGKTNKPCFFITASMHGTEWQGTQYALSFFEQIRDNSFPDVEFRNKLLENYHIVFIPVLNPWGLDRVDPLALNDPGRFNSTGTELNVDFYDNAMTQAETRNMVREVKQYQPFAYLDIHMFQSRYSAAYGRNKILGYGQEETKDIRDLFANSWQNYTGDEVTRWAPPSHEGLARAFVRRQPNPYTPHTLSYITEIVRPVMRNGVLDAPLTDEQIYKYGISSLYLFFLTSFEYIEPYYQEPVVEIAERKRDEPGIFVRNRKLEMMGKLENAHNVSVERRANQLWNASFTLPKDDPKNELCKHFNYIDIYGPSGRYYGKYRILNIQTGLDTVTYECEHVLGILNNYTMPGYHRFENFTTEDVLKQLLDMQTVKHIRLGKVEFSRRFRYDFENHNGLLSAIFEVPQRFNEPYLFTFDTETYPWTLNLIKPDNEVKWDLRWGRDLGNFEEYSDPTGIVNRIYPLGYGEGVNTLDIKSVNNGVPFIEDKQSIEEYGIVARTWIDKRFEDANSLLEEAKAKLSQWKDPRISFTISAVDLSIKEEYKHLTKPLYAVGQIHVDDKVHEARIVGEIIPDLSKEHEVEYEINNKLNELADAQIELERRQYITEAYAQGSTSHDNVVLQDNCDPNHPLIFRIWIPEDVININIMELTYETIKFRGYTRGMKSAGQFTQEQKVQSTTTKGGGGQTTSAGGGQTTSAGGGTTITTPAGGNHRHRIFVRNPGVDGVSGTERAYLAWIPGYEVSTTIKLPFIDTSVAGDIYTFDADGDHTHQVKLNDHTHTVNDHTHEVDDHTHEVEVTIPSIEIPGHTHEQEYGVFEYNKLPTSLTIKVDGKELGINSLEGQNINLVPYLEKDSNDKIKRNRWVTIEITPNDLARINASVVTRFFIQSRIGGKY